MQAANEHRELPGQGSHFSGEHPRISGIVVRKTRWFLVSQAMEIFYFLISVLFVFLFVRFVDIFFTLMISCSEGMVHTHLNAYFKSNLIVSLPVCLLLKQRQPPVSHTTSLLTS